MDISPKSLARRTFLRQMVMAPVIAGTTAAACRPENTENKSQSTESKTFFRFCLNAFSFNKPLLEGTMTINDMLEFAAEIGLAGVDLTGYYFKGYPQVPTDEVIYQTKRRAFSLGLEICGTGVRNDFTHADPAKRRESVRLVKAWIDVAQKLGGQTVRIFSGTQKPEGFTRQQIFDWMVADIRECVEYAGQRGVVVAIQNHDDFLKTADETIQIMNAIQSPWYGLMLDIGSFRTNADPYEEIARTIPYAVTWQIKEKVYVNGKEVDLDADKLMAIIKNSTFRGYLPIESLGAGDARQKVKVLLEKLKRALL